MLNYQSQVKRERYILGTLIVIPIKGDLRYTRLHASLLWDIGTSGEHLGIHAYLLLIYYTNK